MCVYVCMSVCMYVCVYVCEYECVCVCVCECVVCDEDAQVCLCLDTSKRHFLQHCWERKSPPHQQAGASGFQPAPHSDFVCLRCDSHFLSEMGLVIPTSRLRQALLYSFRTRGLLNSQTKYANYLQPHAQSPQMLFLGKC